MSRQTDQDENDGSRRALFIAAGVVAFLTAAVYSRTFSVPFYLDDKTEILRNENLHHPENLVEFIRCKPSRVVGRASHALSWALWGDDPAGYHVENLLIHVIAAEAVFALLFLLLRCMGRPKRESVVLGALGALIFAVHPVQTAAVTYVVQRLESLQGMFVLLSAAVYAGARLRARGGKLVRPGLYVPSIVFAALATFTKQPSFTLPFMLAAVEFLVIQRKKPSRKAAWLLCPYLALSVLLVAVILTYEHLPSATLTVRMGASRRAIAESASGWLHSRYVRYGLTQLKAHLFYLRLVAVPYGQSLDHYFPYVKSITNPWALAGAVVLTWLVVTAYLMRRIAPLVSLAILWYLAALAVSSSFIPILDHVFEHRLYTAMFGYALFLVFVAQSIKPRKVRYVLCAVLVAAYGAATVARNELWRDPVRFWADAARKAPLKARPHGHLADALWARKRMREAERHYLISLNPRKTQASPKQRAIFANNLGALYRELKEHSKAEASFRHAIKVLPNYPVAHYNLGVQLMIRAARRRDKKAYTEGIWYLKRATELDPGYAAAHYYLGIALLKLPRVGLEGKPREAERHLRKAVETDTNGRWAGKAADALKKFFGNPAGKEPSSGRNP